MKKLWTDKEREALQYRIVRLKAGADEELPSGTEGVILSLMDHKSSDGTVDEPCLDIYVAGHGDDGDDFGVIYLPLAQVEVTEAFDEERRKYWRDPTVIRVSGKGELLSHYNEDGEFVPRKTEDD